jgi:cell division protein FtsB
VLRLKNNRLTKMPWRLPLVLLGSLLVTTYFVHHGVFGTHGLIAKDRLISRSNDIEREMAVLEAVRMRLREDVSALRSEPPSPDTVEEVARSALGMIRVGDRIVMREKSASPASSMGTFGR